MVGVTQTEDAGSHSSSSKENDKKDEDTARYICILSIPLSFSVIQLIIYSIIQLTFEYLMYFENTSDTQYMHYWEDFFYCFKKITTIKRDTFAVKYF